MARIKRNKDRPFPWRCGSCDKKEVYRTSTPYKTTIKYEGRPYDVEVPDLELPKCRECGEVVFDDHAGHQINRALRKQLGLLQPDQIRAGRTELGLSQKDLAAQLGVAEESVSRWETGALTQSRVVDRQIRLLFEFPVVRKALRQLEHGYEFGELVKTEQSEPSLPDAIGSGQTSFENLRAAIEHRLQELLPELRDVTRRTAREVSARQYSLRSDNWRDSLSGIESFWTAMATYASMAPPEEIHCATRLFTSWVRRPVPLERKRWFAAYLGPQSPISDPITQRLSRLTRDLENVPEPDAAPLLDHFARLLELWATKTSIAEPGAQRDNDGTTKSTK
ncbi:MAG: type II TA system antitoxin MqsA family protein [Pirellulaceae bacterium]